MAGPGSRRRFVPTPGVFALGTVVASAAWIVVALNAPLGWPARACHVVAAVTVAWLVPGLIGIAAINALLTLAVLALPVEICILGGKLYGWPGAAAGVVVGLLLSPLAAMAGTAAVATLAWLGSPRDADDPAAPGGPPGGSP